MTIHHLRAIGSIDFPEVASDSDPDMIDRKALLVYAGDFESAEGPVSVSGDQLKKLVSNHNSALAKIKRLVAGTTPLRHYPPVQLDHSHLARDTVGRLVGDVIDGEYELPDGRRVPAVYGNLRILGRENVERVKDGRWIELSLGADFDNGMIAELSITPFPAAVGSAMLSAKRREVYCDYPDGKSKVAVEIDDGTGRYHAFIDGKQVGPVEGYVNKETAVTEARKAIEEKLDPGASHTMNQLRSGYMDHQKLKAYLTGHKKMSEKDADEHLARLAKPEGAEDLKKLSGEIEEHEKEEKKAHAAKLTAARDDITKLSTGFKQNVDKARLAAAQGKIMTRLSKLRAQGKVTPAEIKKMDIVKLAAGSDKEVDIVLKTYDDREPVVMMGQLGSIKASDLSQLTAKNKEKAEIEAESRANMSLLRKNKSADTIQLSSQHDERTEGGAPPPVTTDGDKDHMAYFESEYGKISQMMAEGRHGEAKDCLKAFMTKHLAAAHAGGEAAEVSSEATEKHLAALAESVEQMQAQFEEITKLATELVA